MASEELFNATTNWAAQLYAYVGAMAQEIGMERALAVLARVSDDVGAQAGQMFKQQLSITGTDAAAGAELARALIAGSGAEPNITEESPGTFIVGGTGKCPLYEACKMVGLSPVDICTNHGPRMLNAMVKQVNPKLGVQVRKYRSSSEDSCEDVIALDLPFAVAKP